MTIQWASLLAVFAVALASTVAVVGLITLALVGLSARTARTIAPHAPARHPLFASGTGTVVAVACFATAAAIVLLGLWAIVAR